MSDDEQRTLDAWAVDRLGLGDKVLDRAAQRAADAGLPDIAVSSLQGHGLTVLAKIVGAKRILEVGTLAGFSTICLARALPPDGKLITLEIDPTHAEVACDNLQDAGVLDQVEVHIGQAIDTLAKLDPVTDGPIDLTFIDADKENCVVYLEHALRLSRSGSVIVVDNAFRQGRIIDGDTPDVIGMQQLFDAIAANPQLDATALQTAGAKGLDGFILARVR
ncbi:MAG: O-methyltransferase [Planctomycetota bacterium]